MSTKNSSLNFLALLPPKQVSGEIKELKEEISQKYNCKRALRLPAHITLVPPFKMEDERIDELTNHLENFCQDFSEIKVTLDGFGAFPPRVLFIEIDDPEGIRPFRDQLINTLENFLPAENLVSGRPFRPHITLATRDLSRECFYPAWEELKNRHFYARFQADKLTLFRHNGKTWDMKHDFRLKGKEI